MDDSARAVLARDETLRSLIEAHDDITLEPAADPFRRLIVSVIRQQVSMESAAAIRERLFDAVEVTPTGILAAEDERFREAGLSSAKTEYVNAIARYFQALDEGHFEGMSDEAVMAELTDIRGVGSWTAKMFLMFGLAREDVFPVEDLGIRNAMNRLYGYEDRTEMVDHAETWAPYRTYASLALWRSID